MLKLKIQGLRFTCFPTYGVHGSKKLATE